MIFKQLFDQKSSTYTYLIASSKGREALIIDPVLENVSDYIILLKELNLRLVKSNKQRMVVSNEELYNKEQLYVFLLCPLHHSKLLNSTHKMFDH